MTGSFNASTPGAVEASRVLSASPRKMLDLSITNTAGSSRYFHVFDSEAVPTGWNVVEQFTVDFTGLTGADVDQTSMILYDASGAILQPFFGIGDDPVFIGTVYGTLIQVIVTSINNAADIADALVTQLVSNGPFDPASSSTGAVATMIYNAAGYIRAPRDIDTGAVFIETVKGSGAPVLIGAAGSGGLASFDVPVVGKTFSHGIAVINSTAAGSITGSDATAHYSAELLCAAP